MNPLQDISNDIKGFGQEWKDRGKFFLYEPWDVPARSLETLQQAQVDGIDIESDSMTKIFGQAPRQFQSAIHLDTKKEQVYIGPTKGGKTMAVHIEVVIEASHLLPVCMQFDRGVDTGVAREIDDVNVRRWGRHKDGVVVDFDESVKPDGTWDCGNIIGIGKYPVEKFAPPGEKFWVLTTKEALSEKWWPDFKNAAKRIIPPGVIDIARGNNGFNEVDRVVFLTGQRELHFLSYEMGENQFEATDVVHLLVFDEEPYSQQMWITGLTHAQRVVLIETPYNGMTWTGSKEFLKRTINRNCYHATAYDSPYIGKKKIDQWRESMASYQIEARIWAMHSEQKGKPFFNREKIIKWIREETRIHKKAKFIPERGWVEWNDLANLDVYMLPVDDDDRREVFEVYEQPKPGVAYLLTVDTAAGASDPEAAGDNQSIHITRAPDSGEGVDPILCAACVSTMEIIPFTRVILQACRFYNNAMLCPESPSRGASNATAFAYLKDYPFFVKMAVTNDNSGQTEDKPGFAISVATRDLMFKICEDYIARHNVASGIPHEKLLKELSACEIIVKNGRQRPDHPKTGSLDCVMSWGFALFIFKFSPRQVTCNGSARKKSEERPGLLGRVLDRMEEAVPRSKNPFANM